MDLCTTSGVNEPDTAVDVQGIIEVGISSIRRVVELTDQLTDAKKSCITYGKKYEKEVSQLTKISSQRFWCSRRVWIRWHVLLEL